MTNTEGQKVAHWDNDGIHIGIDRGHYPGTLMELNIRIFDTLETLPGSLRTGHTATRIFSTAGYGGAWGGGSRLFPVTDNDVAELRAEAVTLRARQGAAEAALVAAEADYEARVGVHICRHCGTFCSGDCISSRSR